jgi:hypothetical protein
MRTTDVARQVVRELFAAYVDAPHEMPAEHAAQPDRHRAVADYVAGMTDRFAVREHRRLTGARPVRRPRRPGRLDLLSRNESGRAACVPHQGGCQFLRNGVRN